MEKSPCSHQTTREISDTVSLVTGNLVVVSEDTLITHPDDTVSLHVVVSDEDSSIDRLLDDVGEFVDEFHLVLTEAAGASLGEIEKRLVRHPWARKTVLRMTASSHPELYVRDVSSSYLVGESLAGEILNCQFSGGFLLKNLEAVRNSCALLSSADWRLHLEASDWVVSPSQIPMLVKIAKNSHADVVSTKHIREYNNLSSISTWRENLILNVSTIGWTGNLKPSLTGYSSQVCVGNVLLIGNRREETTADLHQDFKLLYQDARARGWRVSSENLRDMILLLVRMGANSLMPRAWTVGPLFDYYSKVVGSPGDEAMIRLLVGSMYEQSGDLEDAFNCYSKASELISKSEIFFKLAFLSFKQEKWLACVDNYERGCRAMGAEQSMNSKLEMATRVLVAVSYYKLNDKLKAQEHIDEVSKANMDKNSVATVWKYIYEVR